MTRYTKVQFHTIYLMLINDKIDSAYWHKEEALEAVKRYVISNTVKIKEIRMKGEFVEQAED